MNSDSDGRVRGSRPSDLITGIAYGVLFAVVVLSIVGKHWYDWLFTGSQIVIFVGVIPAFIAHAAAEDAYKRGYQHGHTDGQSGTWDT